MRVLGRPDALRGELRLPGDKSISHRAFLLNALGEGEALVRGANPGADVNSTREALRALGVSVSERPDGWRIEGRSGRLRPATAAVDCGNSGTTMRLLAGILAAQPFTTTLDGDASLRGRPMARIAEPLRRLGARVEGPDGGRTPPLIITGGRLRDSEYSLPVASAQVKSCLLLAAAAAGVAVRLTEPGSSRDHTELMLQAMGAPIEFGPGYARLRSTRRLRCFDVAVPGDPSAGALVAAAVATVPGSNVRFLEVLVNPRRAAAFEVLERMGVGLECTARTSAAGEEIGEIRVAHRQELRPTIVTADEIPALLDEIPALSVVAAFAPGTTRFEGVGELRVKESDRIESIVQLLGRFGVETHATADVLEVRGGRPRAPARLPGSADHRMLMAEIALAIACLARGDANASHCELPDDSALAVSHPDFLDELSRLGGGFVDAG